MSSSPTDHESLRQRAWQNVENDIAFLRLKDPMSPEEEGDTRRSLYLFHIKRLREQAAKEEL